METKQVQENNSHMALRLKIISGYVLLLVLLGVIVSLVWLEHWKMETLNSGELRACQKREAENRTFEKLLDFSFSDDILLLKDKNKLDEYRMKREMATDALNELKQYYQAGGVQHAQIDRVSSLLLEKEKLLLGAMSTLSDFLRTDSLIQQRIPVIISQTAQQPEVTATTENKRGGLFGLFKKTEEKSAYARQREKRKQQSVSRRTTGELHSLQKEIHAQYTDSWNKLSAYSDSLQQRDRELNSQINELICEFEQTAIVQSDNEAKQMTALREESFRIILFIAVAAILLIVVFYIFIHRDIRQRLAYRMRLEASDRRNHELLTARRNLILTVSHDLRAPLGTICEYAGLLQGEKSGERSKGYAVNILRASRHVIGLANNLLYYYRLEAEKEQPEKEVLHPGRTVEETVHSFLPMAAKKGLGLTVEVTDSDVLVEGDRGRLVQILNNLLSNAVKFTRAGYVHVGARYQNGTLCFFVRDTGTGIDKERQERLFTAFERGETQGTEHGFGLGLAITYKLVTLLEGTIRVQSTPGSGSTFEVCLPMREADGNPGNVSISPEQDSLSGMRVLAMDDDRMQLDVVKKIYARNGVECDCCLNVGELVSALRQNRYDLVLTDMRMPEMDGYGVLSLVRGSNLGQANTLPVLAVTAQADEKPERFRNAGFTGCLYKPFSPEELLAATSCIDRPDFAAIMEGEENREEMLDIFIEDTTEELSGMRDAFSAGNYEKLGHIIHKAAPLWAIIRINIPLGELEKMASMPLEKWDRTLDKRIEKLLEAVEQAIEKAKRLKGKADGNHIDSRG
ncbi:MAG: ATP-binding protein [Bacteroides sp.]|uniref:ATP-binding protein n=1 Tax=Bacteroides sp. TaxID=29523 RepID=UPI0029040165|nr:ATP-binding protein [Bacteroides sp.]MDU1769169.1 ATP-binding protein [Bacteroides sp.]